MIINILFVVQNNSIGGLNGVFCFVCGGCLAKNGSFVLCCNRDNAYIYSTDKIRHYIV